jgi:tetratricopeptide (TPR) repeat protein
LALEKALAYARSKLRRWNPETDYTANYSILPKAIELDPNNVTAYLAKAFYMGFAHDWNEVIRIATAGLAIDPNSAALYAARGTAEGLVGRYDERVSDLETMRKLSPRTRDFFPFWGVRHVRLLRLRKAFRIVFVYVMNGFVYE